MALLDNSSSVAKDLSLSDGVLRTNGALVSIQAPSGWTASMSAKATQPGLPPETFFILGKGAGTKISIGIYFSGMIYEEVDGRIRKEKLFDPEIELMAGSADASSLIGGEGLLANVSQLRNYLLTAGQHAVQSNEKYCRGIKSSVLSGLKSVIFEFQNEDTGARTIEYCIDVLGNGQVVYSLYYRAPIGSFGDEKDTAVKTFNSSVWRKDFDPFVALEAIN